MSEAQPVAGKWMSTTELTEHTEPEDPIFLGDLGVLGGCLQE